MSRQNIKTGKDQRNMPKILSKLIKIKEICQNIIKTGKNPENMSKICSKVQFYAHLHKIC